MPKMQPCNGGCWHRGGLCARRAQNGPWPSPSGSSTLSAQQVRNRHRRPVVTVYASSSVDGSAQPAQVTLTPPASRKRNPPHPTPVPTPASDRWRPPSEARRTGQLWDAQWARAEAATALGEAERALGEAEKAREDLCAHQLLAAATSELALHLAGLPADLEQQVASQVDAGAPLLGDGGSATVHVVRVDGAEWAVKVAPLHDVWSARPHHLRDVVTALLPTPPCPHLERPLHAWLRVQDAVADGFPRHALYTLWHRRHCDVDQLLARRRLEWREQLTVLLHTARALTALAAARLVHGDVKPPNVLVVLGPDGRVVSAHLTDMGSTQPVPAGCTTAPAVWGGQLAWNWPPEQREAVHLEASDAWGLAVLYACMHTGDNPSNPDLVETLQDPRTPPGVFDRLRDRELLPHLSGESADVRKLTALMRRCINRNVARRPPLSELLAVIQELYDAAA